MSIYCIYFVVNVFDREGFIMDFLFIIFVYFNYRISLILGLNCENWGFWIYSGVIVGFSLRGKEVVSYCFIRWKVVSGDVICYVDIVIFFV